MKVGTTFSGLGAVSVAAERLGIEPVFHADIEKNSKAVLAHHWPEVSDLGDIKEINHVPDHDILTAGFPCQDLSVGGKRAGLEGARSGLFWEVVRLLEGSRPAWFVLENVPGLLSSNGGRDMGAVVRSLGDLGYSVAWRVLDARFFGVPQRRRRVFIVGHLGAAARAGAVLLEREGGEWVPPTCREEGSRHASSARQSDEGSGELPVGHAYKSGHSWWSDGEGVAGPLTNRGSKEAEQVVVQVHYQKIIRSGARDAEGNLPPEVWAERDVTATLNTFDVGSGSRAVDIIVEIDGSLYELDSATLRVRRLTPLECERLQGLPDHHTLVPARTLKDGRVKKTSDSARYALLGNSAAVPVLEWVLRGIQRVEGI